MLHATYTIMSWGCIISTRVRLTLLSRALNTELYNYHYSNNYSYWQHIWYRTLGLGRSCLQTLIVTFLLRFNCNTTRISISLSQFTCTVSMDMWPHNVLYCNETIFHMVVLLLWKLEWQKLTILHYWIGINSTHDKSKTNAEPPAFFCSVQYSTV